MRAFVTGYALGISSAFLAFGAGVYLLLVNSHLPF